MQPDPSKPSPLEITDDAQPSVPVFVCLVYVRTNEDSTVSGRVANWPDLAASGSSERDVLGKLVSEFKSEVAKRYAEKQEMPWLEPPPEPSEGEHVRSIPVHL
ncbi:MAG: hypothetical protein RH917_11415 [Lacipirellulaceae bacterium]